MPAPRLLSDTDPAVFRVIEGRPGSPYMIAADHAGRAIPAVLGRLGLSERELDLHVAWDVGIGGVSVALAAELGAFMIMQNYSRLVIDCNRPLGASTSIVAQSEYTVVPGNADVSAAEAEMRAREVFHPYHDRIEAEVTRRERAGEETIFLAMHSFTPRFKGFDRPWHCGVLYHRDARLARPVLELLRREGLEVGDNQPYSVSEDSDYGVPAYGERRGNLHLEFEIRQDLITTPEAQESWGKLLGRVIPEAVKLAKGGS